MPDPGAYWFEKEELEAAGINITQLKTLAVLLPTLTEQQEIVRRVECLFAKADQIEASYQKQKQSSCHKPCWPKPSVANCWNNSPPMAMPAICWSRSNWQKKDWGMAGGEEVEGGR